MFDLCGLSREALSELIAMHFQSETRPNMRASQLYKWIYRKGVRAFDHMTDISATFRAQLNKSSVIGRLKIIARFISSDGTRKYILQTYDGLNFEAVYIPEENRGTLCVSSQIGCTLNCTFCHTGTQKLRRNLTAAEIVGQVMVCLDDLDLWAGIFGSSVEARANILTNIVFMGMGEPLYNFDAVKDAIAVLSDDEGLNFSKRKITISTAGVVPMIHKIGQEIGCLLAVSLHATTDDIRDRLVPINRKWNLASLQEACKAYPSLSNARRITFEYTMLQSVNDSDKDAKGLIQFLSGIPAKVNLIPFNTWVGTAYQCSSRERIEAFASIVYKAGYSSPIRKPRGRDIMAACGQLNTLVSSAPLKSEQELSQFLV